MKGKAEARLCLIFDAQINCRVSTLVTQTSGSVYWPQVLVINIHDAGACAFLISECLSFPDLSVNTFKVDVFFFFFSFRTPIWSRITISSIGSLIGDALQPVVDSSFYEHFIFDTAVQCKVIRQKHEVEIKQHSRGSCFAFSRIGTLKAQRKKAVSAFRRGEKKTWAEGSWEIKKEDELWP